MAQFYLLTSPKDHKTIRFYSPLLQGCVVFTPESLFDNIDSLFHHALPNPIEKDPAEVYNDASEIAAVLNAEIILVETSQVVDILIQKCVPKDTWLDYIGLAIVAGLLLYSIL